MRIPFALLLSLYCPLAAAQSAPPAEAPADVSTASPAPADTGTARVRVFSQNGAGVSVSTRRQCVNKVADGEHHHVREGVSILKAPDNVRIGMPDTSYSREVSSSTGTFSRRKPYFHEFTIVAGVPTEVGASFRTTAAYCDKYLSLAFIPVAGTDYEFAMTTSNTGCNLTGRRIGDDGVTYPVATSPRVEHCQPDPRLPGYDLMVFLFEPGSVQYKLEGSLLAPPETVGDTDRFADAFERRVAAAAARDVRACVVVPEADYQSALHTRLMAAIGPDGRNRPMTVTLSEDVPRMPGNPGNLSYREAALHCTLPGVTLPPTAAP